MKYAFIFDGVVVNTVIAEADSVQGIAGPHTPVLLAADSPVGVGWLWSGGEFSPPPEAPALPPDARLWWIDVGPFKDRLGMDIGAIASSQHSACLGVREFLLGRKYVNLQDPKVALLMDVLIATNQPTADPVWPGSGPLTPSKKAAILTTPTTEDERYIKGL